jgi:valyl-tRNA synthetase
MGLSKTFEPAAVEAKWYPRWERSGAFRCGVRKNAKPFTIVIPPPNVTGSLHMGHALDNTLQDVLVRFERMRGHDVLWQPGIDHAGIATQMVVERNLAAEGVKRQALGREKFLEKVWAWKVQSGGTISLQLRRLGASCNWSRERFTMDEGFSQAVVRKFVTLYREGLIYKDKRLVNWDPKLLTAISDLEVENREVDGQFWHFRYPIEGMPGTFIVVATTRPETMLGDTAVAVHAEGPRYKKLIGKMVAHPLTGRKIPIIADEIANPEEGSGAVKITPAHDFNDFEVGKRHKLPMISVLDRFAAINENAPTAYRGMDRFDARKKVVADLEALGLVEKVEPRKFVAPFGDRSGVLVEPYLTDQWYVDAKKLAQPAIKAVEKGETEFVPANWAKTYFEWMRNIQPWCVSRQLWWGHRIPAWYADDGSIFVAESAAEAEALAKKKYKKNMKLTQDEDVLDTWFSSALWPMGTLGWPEKTKDLQRYYPTSVLVTGFDIIFFWVARMMMDGLHFMKKVPFKTVYIHGLIRDEKGQKMSKAKGNVIDPLDFIGKYGADALRFTLATLETQGRDIKLSENRVAGYRNFATKLWNAARFCEMNGAVDAAGFDPKQAKLKVNQWIVGETRRAAEAVTRALETFHFNEAADAIYHFTWHTYCDWYVEFIKPVLMESDAKAKAETQKAAAWALDQILALLHPFMPFITEELWHAFGAKRKSDLILAPWPDFKKWPSFQAAGEELNWVVNAVSGIRSSRAEVNVPPAAKVKAFVRGAAKATQARLASHRLLIERLARVEGLATNEPPNGAAIQVVVDEATFVLPLEGVIDVAAEKARLQKGIEAAAREAAALEAKLKNKGFTANAPEAVVLETKERLDAALATRKKLEDALRRLG